MFLININILYSFGRKIEKLPNSFRDVSPLGPCVKKNLHFDLLFRVGIFKNYCSSLVLRILLALIDFARGA